MTSILAKCLGLPDLRYEACSAPPLRNMLMGAGLPDNATELPAEHSRAIEDGRIRSGVGRTTVSTMATHFAELAACPPTATAAH